MDAVSAVTKSQLVNEIRKLGLTEGQTVMLHASVKSIGPIVGGPQTILEAVLEIITSSGTLVMLVGWEDNPYNIFNASIQDNIDQWPENKRLNFYETCPAFDPEHSRSDIRKMGILTEYLRTYPGSLRSRHPLGYAAVGKLAQHILKDQQWQYREGSGSPLEKLCDVGGKVFLLGAPTSTVTLIHYAENHAKIPNKKIVRYKMPILQDGEKVWKDFEEYDFINGIVPWPEDYFKSIVDEYIEKGNGVQGTVGMAQCHLFDAKDLNNFSVKWMERNFCCLEDGE
ncbi:aminoglycoside 3-N-acetyltransferase [Prosthecochloris sp. GSB1]|uniref:aminoglycoside 3-N-acetyltransferase n=1 Tax=Prosthecochloris sp. GSB1 TaxID=281093 RepID=UPI000B8CAB64|nr:aminoglycoside 3-N-acetyltransferase [Prosthecochloris sp. GSB1]ASQ90603.1 aminoglycoside 3-N-acetyltransferase [Prosthecochloris sp. GSB1]